MRYRILDHSEWDRLKDIMDPAFIPHPMSGSCAVAEDDEGNIQGAWFLQLAMHLEPLILKSAKVNFQRLHDTIYNAIKESKGLHLYAFSQSELVDKMAEHIGMRALPCRVYEKVVGEGN